MNGEMEGLLQVLSEEIVLHADGGGKVRTARYPLSGPDRVARYLLGIEQNVFPGITVALRPMLINGQPGLVGYLEEGRDEKPRRSPERERKENSSKPGAWHERALEKGEAAFAIGLLCADKQARKSISSSTRRNCGTFLLALGTTLASSFQAELFKNTTPNGVMYTKRGGCHKRTAYFVSCTNHEQQSSPYRGERKRP